MAGLLARIDDRTDRRAWKASVAASAAIGNDNAEDERVEFRAGDSQDTARRKAWQDLVALVKPREPRDRLHTGNKWVRLVRRGRFEKKLSCQCHNSCISLGSDARRRRTEVRALNR